MYFIYPDYWTILVIILSLILSAIALLHFYWAAGGKWASNDVFPTKENGETIFEQSAAIPTLPTIAVGIGLLAMIGFIFWSNQQPPYLKWGCSFFGLIFLIRSIGEFKYVGFFKKIKNTPFGKKDTRYYSPLSLSISILFFGIGWTTPMMFVGTLF